MQISCLLCRFTSFFASHICSCHLILLCFCIVPMLKFGQNWKILHYKNLPMQYTEIFFSCKNGNFLWKFFHIFNNNFVQNIDCGYTQSMFNECPQSMFWSKNQKNRYTPAYPSFAIKKWCIRSYTLHGHVACVVGRSRFLEASFNSY